MAATSNATSLSKSAGLAIMAGIVLLLIGSILYPGGMLVDPVDQTDFGAALDALSANASLAHFVTMVSAIGMLLYAYGFFTLLRQIRQQQTMGDLALRFGVVISMFGWGIFILGMGMRHGVIHFLQRSEMESGADAAALGDLALVCHAVTIGLILAFLIVYPLGSSLLGMSLAPRFGSLNVYKLASFGLVLVGLAGFINYLIVQYAASTSVETLLISNNLTLSIGALFLAIIGLGMHRGVSELNPE